VEQDTAVRRSRRAILGAAVGGAAAIAATSVAKPLGVRAATGDPLALGNPNTADAETLIENTTADTTTFKAQHGAGTGLWGESLDSTPQVDWSVESRKTGVVGTAGPTETAHPNSDECGVFGFSDISENSRGMFGQSPMGWGVEGSGGNGGVFGVGYWGVLGTGGIGIAGDVGVDSVGVYGFTGVEAAPTPPGGVGVYARAETTSLTALQVVGKAKFSRSGRVSISSTATSKTVVMGGVSTSSYIIATLQTSVSGVYVRAVVPASGSFKIYLSKAAGKTAYIGYLVIN